MSRPETYNDSILSTLNMSDISPERTPIIENL